MWSSLPRSLDSLFCSTGQDSNSPNKRLQIFFSATAFMLKSSHGLEIGGPHLVQMFKMSHYIVTQTSSCPPPPFCISLFHVTLFSISISSNRSGTVVLPTYLPTYLRSIRVHVLHNYIHMCTHSSTTSLPFVL